MSTPWPNQNQHPARTVVVDEPKLTRLMERTPHLCASVSEYATRTGIPLGRVLDLFSPALEQGWLALEPVGAEVFVNTAPQGRPSPPHTPEIAPNLWERLRVHGGKHVAHQLWLLHRSLEQAGWVVDPVLASIMFGLSPVTPAPQLGLRINHKTHPLLTQQAPSDLASVRGHVARVAEAGADVVAVIVDSGALDEAVTAVRKLYLSGAAQSTAVLLLEAPRYTPLLLSPDGASVVPQSANFDPTQ